MGTTTVLVAIGIYLAAGAVAGILAGLLGIGGGLVIVPMLAFCFSLQGFDNTHIMHLALGTSLASIIFTSLASFITHHRMGAVHWNIVMRIVPGIFTGSLLGAYVASLMSTNVLKGFFIAFLYYAAMQILLGRNPAASRKLPGGLGMFGAGNIIGSVSGLLGIGGGTLSIPFLMWCNIRVHHAVGTAAAIGFPIAVSGTLGYILTGMRVDNLPVFSIGFLFLPALFGIVTASMLTAPFGAKLAHRLPVSKLKNIFALFLFVVGTRMLVSLL